MTEKDEVNVVANIIFPIENHEISQSVSKI